MLKRKDLAKEFELVVQQEIKNHNDSMLATNISLNEFRARSDLLAEKLAEISARVEGKINRLYVLFQGVENRITSSIQKQYGWIDKIESVSERNITSLENALFSLEEKTVEKEEQREVVDGINVEINTCKNELHSQKNVLMASMSLLREDLVRLCEQFRDDILSRPNELWEVKLELEKKIECSKIDSDGVLKEVRGYKKSMFILEKKIEDLYNKIERLNKRVAE